MLSRDIFIEEMTWPEVKEKLEAGYDTVIVMAGSIEQHGPHLPTKMDAHSGEVLAKLFAERLGNTLVAPIIRPGCSEHHMYFPGSMTLRKEVFQDVVRDYVDNMYRHGFKKIILATTHGGNFEPMYELVPELKEKYEPKGVKIIDILDFDDFVVAQNSILEEFDLTEEEAGVHSGGSETSFLMASEPESVRTDKLARGYVGKFDAEFDHKLHTEGMQSVTDIGVLGDATKASKEFGEKLIDALADYYVRKAKEAL
ncbi:MAG: creatininase family protein [Firmicutes bacterium]|nr:creatininase family protein [Bacillota bacterium]